MCVRVTRCTAQDASSRTIITDVCVCVCVCVRERERERERERDSNRECVNE